MTDLRGRILSANPVERAVDALRMGWILALKIREEFQLLTDATNRGAVQRLRDKSRQRQQSFPVMVASVEEAERYVGVDSMARGCLADCTGPVRLPRRGTATNLAGEVSPGLDHVDVILPATPVHRLFVLRFGRPLVCTHGNLFDAKPSLSPSEIQESLIGIADALLNLEGSR